jgi:hypothetical protein
MPAEGSLEMVDAKYFVSFLDEQADCSAQRSWESEWRDRLERFQKATARWRSGRATSPGTIS